ncbi:rod shape-determining protein MreC [Comamonas sp. UBA7528]|uniref:rod shape-determining protein MreC n=1 Tax=Comamonas sp. UBA7528 TaxID=1946391 RepID=UPI0025BF0B15|nr:rod shape-determining protein MreC [Comamonas sp. UBA7528]
MSMGTLERSAPSMFKQGPSALSQLVAYSALALFLMVADARFKVVEPVRQVVSTVLYPVQWAMVQPIRFFSGGVTYFDDLESAQQEAQEARQAMLAMAQRATQSDQLLQENEQLRQLLALRDRVTVPAKAAQVIYDTPDPYTRRVVIDKGQVAGVLAGSPVIDERGVLGQVTRVQPFLSEVRLLVDRDQAIPVLNQRTGERSVAYGDPSSLRSDAMELRFMPSNADVKEGDLLTTSGVDGVYPSGLPVAKVSKVERRAESAFARIYCEPVARLQGARHVMILEPMDKVLPDTPHAPEPPTAKRDDKSASRRSTDVRLPGQKEAKP